MAHFSVHCQDCKRELGEEFQDVNIWLDDYFKDFGPDHRPIRHHDLAILKIKEMWGEKASKAAEIHIKKDNRGIRPRIEDEFLHAVMSPNSKVFQKLKEEFGDNERLAKQVLKFTKQ